MNIPKLEVSDFWEKYNSLTPEDKQTVSRGYFFEKYQKKLSDEGKNLEWECYHLTHPKESA